jgi:hypothetical protein
MHDTELGRRYGTTGGVEMDEECTIAQKMVAVQKSPYAPIRLVLTLIRFINQDGSNTLTIHRRGRCTQVPTLPYVTRKQASSSE